jgi:type IV fimbrial biogenesis protein FimT
MFEKQRGLTVLELIISLSLAAVLAGLAIPSMTTFIANQRITAATNEMIAHLQFARLEAVTRHQNVVACPSLDQQRCAGNRWDRGWMIFADADDNRQPDTISDVLRVIQADPRAVISSGGRERVRFQPGGGAYGTNLTLRICAASAHVDGRAVIVSNPGRVRMNRRLSAAECQD